MKKYVMILAAALAFAACQKEAAVKDEPVNEELNTYTFTAVVDDNVVDADTKATVSRSGVFSWVGGEELTFFDTLGEDYPAVVSSVSEGVATITVTATGTPTFATAIYPAAAASAKNKVNFSARGPIVVAEVGSGALTFHHIGSIINVKISGIPAGTESLVITPASAFGYDGTFSFTAGVPSLTSTGTTSSIVVPANSLTDSGNDITISVPAVSITGGFTIVLNNAADGSGRNLYKKATTKNYDLTGTKLLNMKALTYERPNPKSIKLTTSSTSGWWDVTDAPLIQTSANTFELSINTDPSTTYNIYDEYNDDALSGTINGSETAVVDGTLYVGGSAWDWAKPKSGPRMAYVGTLHIAHNVTVSDNTYFKITNGTDFNSGNVLGAHVDGYSLGINSKYDSEWDEGHKDAFKIATGGTYDFYQQNTYVWYKNAGVDDESSHTTLISYDVSTGVATITDKGIAKASIGRSDRTYDNEVAFVGSFNSWNAANVMTYNDNHIWSSDLVIASAGDYEFKFIHKNDWSVQWRNDNNGNNYPASASQLFGTSNKLGEVASGYSFTVSLEAATYKVYVNDYTWDSNKFKFAFVKQ